MRSKYTVSAPGSPNMPDAGVANADHGYAQGRTGTAPFIAWIGLLGGIVLAAAFLLRHEDEGARPTLAPIAPIIAGSMRVGAFFIAHVWSAIAIVSACVVLASSVAIYRGIQAGPRQTGRHYVAAIVSLSVLCEVSLLHGRLIPATAFFLLALAIAIRHRSGLPLPTHSFAWRDVAILAVLTAVAGLLRFYELNRISDVFEGELSPYYLAATHLSGIPLGNSGVNGPWAPLGYLYFLPIFAAIKIFGPTVLAIRFSSAAVALCTLSLLYRFSLETYGRTAAVLAGLFYTLDPLQIGWGRTDVHAHGVTTWPVLLIALLCLRAFPSGGLRWFALLVPVMAVTWHQYPSGQTAVFIPVLMLGITLVRRKPVSRLGTKIALLGLGVAGWVAGPMLTRVPGGRVGSFSGYFTQLGNRVAWPGGGSAGLVVSAERLLRHSASLTGDVIAGLFVRLRYVFHQDVFVPVPELPSRSISWMVGALVIAGVCLIVTRRQRTTADWILISWITVAIVPAIFSDHAYPKRSATLFPALFVIAAATGARFLLVLEQCGPQLARTARVLAGSAFVFWFCSTSWLWFSGIRWHEGVPNESLLVQQVRPELTRGTIVIAKLWHGYAPGKLTYLLSAALRDPARGPLLLYILTPDRDLQSIIDRPAIAATYASPGAFYYAWAGLRPPSGDQWPPSGRSKVLYVLQTGIDTPEHLRIRGIGSHERLDREWLTILERSCGPPLVSIPPREDCEDCGFVVVACGIQRGSPSPGGGGTARKLEVSR